MLPTKFIIRFSCLIFFLSLLLTTDSVGQCISIQSGEWGDASTWSCENPSENRVPLCTDMPITIAAGHTVEITSQQNYSCNDGVYMVIYVQGVLSFETGNKLSLPAGSFIGGDGDILAPTNGSGSSSLIDIGGVDVWLAGDGDVSGPFQFPASHPLPVELLNFDAKLNGTTVDLSWATATETNNEIFIVERAKDELEWEQVLSVSGAGNSTSTLYYNEVDQEPFGGVSYYRLKQIDLDGTASTSWIESIFNPESGLEEDFISYPNPNPGESVFLIIPEEAVGKSGYLEVFDESGHSLNEYHVKEFNPVEELFHTGFPSGVYNLRIETESVHETHRLIIR